MKSKQIGFFFKKEGCARYTPAHVRVSWSHPRSRIEVDGNQIVDRFVELRNMNLSGLGFNSNLSSISRDSKLMLEEHGIPMDQGSFSMDVVNNAEDSFDRSRLSLESMKDQIPYVGQKFVTHDAAYDFYSEFAKRTGFSIRRHRTEGKDGVGSGLTRRYFVCHRAGNTPIKVTTDDLKQRRNRKSSRCGCSAYLRVSKTMDMGIPEWRITGFKNYHNHELLEPNEVRFLPAYRKISENDKSRILMFAKTGISVQQMMRLLELEKCVEPGYLSFTEKDVRNLLQTCKKVDQIDIHDLLRICRNIKERDTNFRYEFMMDVNNKLENIAWSYAPSIQSYEIFGDVVLFDTSRRLPTFDMPLGIWIGINNYGMPCLFGCVLLREESMLSFSWAIKTFLSFMNGRAPQTVLTDQNMCLKEAIDIEIPQTKHAFAIWLIAAKFPAWFNSILGERYNEWKVELYRLHNLKNIDDFELSWDEMISSFGFCSNKHIADLFAIRNLWALPYLRNHFFAGMMAPCLSKSINSFIQRFLSLRTHFTHFIEQVAVTVDFKNQAAEQQMVQQNICLKTCGPMESQAAAILTPYAFDKLQDELVSASQYTAFQIDDGSFVARQHTKRDGGRKVIWIPEKEILSCSCNMFEFSGILCRHALRVLSAVNYFEIPCHYLPLRWRRTNSLSTKVITEAASNEHDERIKILQSMVAALVSEASKSTECLNLAYEEVSLLLSRLREQPVTEHMSTEIKQTVVSSNSIPVLSWADDSFKSGTNKTEVGQIISN